MATLEQIAEALRKADAAGNVEDARALANAYRQMQAQQSAPAPQRPSMTPEQMAQEYNLPVPGMMTPDPEQPVRHQSLIPGGDMLNEFAESFVENIPVVGPLATRAADTVGGEIASLLFGGPADQYREQAGTMRAQNASQNPIANAAGTVAGTVGPLMAAGTTQLGGQALGLTGPMPQRMAAGGLSGGIIAGLDTAARGGDTGDSLTAFGIGAGLGAGMPLAERALNPIARMLFGGYNPPASTTNINRSLERAGIEPQAIPQRLDALGPDAMLLDLDPNLTRQGAAIASLPGEGQSTLSEALVSRNLGTNSRIQGDVDTILGPAVGPRAFNQQITEAQRGLSPLYETAFANSKAVDTSGIALNLDSLAVAERGEAQAVATRLRDMLNVAGETELDRDPRTLFAVRRAIDGMFDTVQDGNARRVLSETRKQVDELLTDAVPGIKDVDAQFALLAKQRQGFETGQQALDSGRSALTPDDLAALVAQSPDDVVNAMSLGTRAEIDRIIGTTANNLTALKSALKGDGSWNRERLVTLFGKDKADRLLDVLDRESTFQRSYNMVLGNSETAARQAAQKEAAPRQFDLDIQRLLFALPNKLANAAAGSRSEAVNAQIAEMLMGRPSPELIEQLLAARQANRGVLGSSAVPLLVSQ